MTTDQTENTSNPEHALKAPTKRAFLYVRVSSEGQRNTGYDSEGLSINAQREAGRDKAQQLNAEIVREFADPGRSAFTNLHKRTDFLELLDELKRLNERDATRIDYVIVWALNRWARNVQDHHRTRELVKEAGAQIVSITEPMIGDDTPEAFFTEGIFALNNQYESMKTGRNVRQGMHQKAKGGGTYYAPPLGYQVDLERLPDGRQVRSISLDPKRHAFATLAFKLYASGEYSISQLAKELERLGLRTRPTKKYSSRPLGTSAIHNMLRNRYYAGWIVYKKGTPDEQVFRGRHEPLVDEETFNAVQALLAEKRVAGERPQKHHHYLKGSVYCADCGRRLVYGISTGQNGRRYAYFFCAGRINGNCDGQRPNMRPELVEDAVLRHYEHSPPSLSTEDVKARIDAVEALVAVSQQAVAQVRQAKAELIEKLKNQQARLLRLHLEEGDSVSPDAFRDERARLQSDLEAAESSLAETDGRLSLDSRMLRMALELAEDLATVYRLSDQATRRGYNQAFYKYLKIRPEWDEESGELIPRVVGAELTEPYAALLAANLAHEVVAEAEQIGLSSAETTSDPEGSPVVADISNFSKLVPPAGFEPATIGLEGRRSVH
jgi:site-specific DNA recombinase